MSKSYSYNEWDDRISRKNRKAENRKNRKRVNSNEIMERFRRGEDDEDFYRDNEKFHQR